VWPPELGPDKGGSSCHRYPQRRRQRTDQHAKETRARSCYGQGCVFWPSRALLVCAWTVAAWFALLRTAHAEDKVARLSEELANASDFRVRTQAALALGATKSKRAVKPLCRGLGDTSAAVRAASAAALGKLALGGKDCLQEVLPGETSPSVKTVIKRSLARLDESEGDKLAFTAATKYYVTLEVSDKTGRSGDGVAQQVWGGFSKAAAALPEFLLAPQRQPSQSAKQALADHPKVRGFLLSAQVQKPSYSGKALTVRLDVAIATFPDKNLKGTLPVNVTMQGVSARDAEAEDELIQSAAQRAMEKFAQTAERIR
jgi:hypothetical protein